MATAVRRKEIARKAKERRMIGLGVAQAYAALGRVDPVLAIWGVEFLGELNDWPPEKVERLRSHYLARVVQGKGA